MSTVEHMRIQIQPAGETDIPSLITLMSEFYAESNFELDKEWARTSFLNLISEPDLGGVWIAFRGNLAVGHVVLTLRYTMEHGSMSGYIDDLYVEPDSRRSGVGRALVDQLYKECVDRKCGSLYVEVGAHNQAARQLYSFYGLHEYTDGRVLLNGSISEPSV